MAALCPEQVTKAFGKLLQQCKDRHAYLKAALSFVGAVTKDPVRFEALTADGAANLYFYPLKVACESREDNLVAIALNAIQELVAHGGVPNTALFKAPDVPAPAKKKGFFGLGGDDGSSAPKPVELSEESPTLLSVVTSTVCHNAMSLSEEVQAHIVRNLLMIVSFPGAEVHGKVVLSAIQTSFSVFLHTKSVSVQATSKAALSQIIGVVQQRAETELLATVHSPAASATDPSPTPDATADDSDAATPAADAPPEVAPVSAPAKPVPEGDGGVLSEADFRTPSERDCFMILRALSKLAVKPAEGLGVESPELRGRLHSLNMIYHCIVNAPAALREARSFRVALQQYVSRSLLENCLSPAVDVARVAMHTMQRLVCEYRDVLQRETLVFFYNVIFPVLESTNSSYEQRVIVLQVLEAVLGDAQVAMDLFVNHDCNINAQNLTSDMVNRVSRAVQQSHTTANWISAKQDNEIRAGAVRCLAAMCSGLVEWVTECNECDATQHANTRGAPALLERSSGDAGVEVELSMADATTSGESSIDRMIKGKRTYEALIEIFNRKGAKEGIAFAVREDIVKDDANTAEVAAFLLTKGFDKLRIGEYLAANKPFIKDVLKAFIERFDFTGLAIDEAMRLFLGKFKIQGEAETVDRTMERFAEHYCAQNPDAFGSPGSAYVLSFSIMMLNTDAHSVHVKDKMKLTDFLRTLRGVDDGKDFPEAFLCGIYERITTREIRLDGDPGATAKPQVSAESDIFTSLAKKKTQGYKKDADAMVRSSMMALSEPHGNAAAAAALPPQPFMAAAEANIAKAFWEAAWTAVLPALALPMEESVEEDLVDCCLLGFDRAISLSCLFGDATEREAFLSSLSGFTHLTSRKSMEYKNVKSIAALMAMAHREADALEGSWYEVLKCISLLDKLHIVGCQDSQNSHARSGSVTATTTPSGPVGEHRRIESHKAEIIANYFDVVELDRIFSKSGELSGRAVVFLVETLCRVSAEELAEPSPRTYSLQKLVEVAELNIGRLRYVWSQMWVHLSRHFISAGVTKQQLVAMYVVDGLRQLAVKFLARDELGSLGFQRDFMKPFEVIASNSPRPDIRELIIASLGQMVDSKATNIMSGWHSVLVSLCKCASAAQPSVVTSAAGVLQRITFRKMHLLNTIELFTDVVNAWSMFGGNTVDRAIAQLSIQTIRLLGVFAAKGVPPAGSAYYSATEDMLGTASKPATLSRERVEDMIAAELLTIPNRGASGQPTFADLRTWLSIFAALSSLTSVPDGDVRREALNTLFATISDHAAVFSREDWDMILGGTVQPIFDNVFCDISMLEHDRRGEGKRETTAAEEEEYKAERRAHIRLLEGILELYVSLFAQHHVQLAHHLPSLIEVLLTCNSRNDPQVTNAGQSRLQAVLTDGALPFTEADWAAIVEQVSACMIAECEGVERLESFLASNRVHEATTHLHAVVRTVMTVTASLTRPNLPIAVAAAWMRLCQRAYTAACCALDSPGIAPTLRRIVTGRIVLDLIREAARGMARCSTFEELVADVDAWTGSVLRRLLQAAPGAPELPVLLEISLYALRQMIDLPDDKFATAVGVNYGVLCALVGCPDALIRKCTGAIFLRFGAVSGAYTPSPEDEPTRLLPEAPDIAGASVAERLAFSNVGQLPKPEAMDISPSSSPPEEPDMTLAADPAPATVEPESRSAVRTVEKAEEAEETPDAPEGDGPGSAAESLTTGDDEDVPADGNEAPQESTGWGNDVAHWGSAPANETAEAPTTAWGADDGTGGAAWGAQSASEDAGPSEPTHFDTEEAVEADASAAPEHDEEVEEIAADVAAGDESSKKRNKKKRRN